VDAVGTWGSTTGERAQAFPCDGLIVEPDRALFRAVDVDAPAPVVFRWLCQLRVAPYSYDWLDNLGQRSPRKLTPGVEQLEVGQRVMTIFRLAHFEPGAEMTVVTDHRLFGRVAATYRVSPRGPGASRLVVKVVVAHPGGPVGRLMAGVLPVGDFVMMRRQLLNLKRWAEVTAASGP
jgi:hypothetical protein